MKDPDPFTDPIGHHLVAGDGPPALRADYEEPLRDLPKSGSSACVHDDEDGDCDEDEWDDDSELDDDFDDEDDDWFEDEDDVSDTIAQLTNSPIDEADLVGECWRIINAAECSGLCMDGVALVERAKRVFHLIEQRLLKRDSSAI